MDLRPGNHTDGRPSKLTSAVQAAVVEVLARGGTYTEAAEAGGIGVRTLYSWVSKGTRRQKGDRNGNYHPFATAVRRATAQAARTAAAERRQREAEGLATQPPTPRNTEQRLLRVAKTLHRALHPPLPGTPEAAAFEREYSRVHTYLGITRAEADEANDEDEEEDEAEQERLLALWRRIREREAHNLAILRSAAESRAPFYLTAEPRLPRDDQE